MIAPIFDPELKIPVANALSFLGNHSAVALIAAGKLPASVMPKKILAILKPPTPVAKIYLALFIFGHGNRLNFRLVVQSQMERATRLGKTPMIF
jgi:hypothetical protein